MSLCVRQITAGPLEDGWRGNGGTVILSWAGMQGGGGRGRRERSTHPLTTEGLPSGARRRRKSEGEGKRTESGKRDDGSRGEKTRGREERGKRRKVKRCDHYRMRLDAKE